jgi:4-hydroxyphenylpyruvate dioxygenase
MQNPIEIRGIEFVEFASHDPDALHRLFLEFGFSRVMRHAERPIDLYVQGEIHFLLNRDPRSFAASFEQAHGPCIASMGWKTALPPIDAARLATERGATAMKGDYRLDHDVLPGIRGIGDSMIYMVPASGPGTGRELWARMGFRPLQNPDVVKEKGFRAIDHLTNNVVKGTMARTAAFYKEVFGFTEVRYFDIRGAKTGLTSYALRSPDGSFCIPINEGTEAKSQINEYLEEYRGPGVQHLAFLTDDILSSLAALEGAKSISFLDIDDEYYADVFAKHPAVTEDHAEIRKRNVLVDGDDQGYLLQIFTKNLVGPIFIEIIQRHNHLSFGEGNFGALFRSIERDQEKRGYLS